MKYSKYNIFLLLIILLNIDINLAKIYDENFAHIHDDYYGKSFDKEKKYYYNKFKNNNHDFNKYADNEDEYFEKPKSTLEFFITYIKNRILSFFNNFEEYFLGLKYVISKYKYLFRRFSKNKIINKTLSNNHYSKKFIKKEDFLKQKTQRKLEQKYTKNSKSKNIDDTLSQSYPYNNTDLYDKINCPIIPDLKVYYYYYFCGKKKVSKEEYLNRTSQGEHCEFYNNTQKICFCPIHYSSCQFKTVSKLKCMVNKLIVNDEFDLTKYYDTFYDEHTKIPIVDNDKKIFNFSLNLKCGFELDDSISGSDANFYLINSNDEFSEFDIISTEYHNITDNGTQYTKEEVMNNTNKILKYFIKKKNLILYKKTILYLKFSIIDQMWAIPYRTQFFEINEDMTESFLSGEVNCNFTIDLNDLIENGEGEGPFEKTDNKIKYPYFDKGDLHFFEIELKDFGYNQIRFVPFRGEIKK